MERPTKPTDVKPFSFQSFETESGGQSQARAFEFRDLSTLNPTIAKPSSKIIRAEREAESRTAFKIDTIVRDLRGLSSQEKDDLELKIGHEVEQRLKKIQEQAYREGLERGRMEGADAALREAMEKHQRQIAQVEQMLLDLKQHYEATLDAHKHEIYEMTKRLLKWLVFKELGDESYLPKLLEKLILEMGQRRNLILRVNPSDFRQMPQLLEQLQAKIGELPNVRVEPDMEMQARGLVVESENQLIQGTLESLFSAIDKMFESAVNHA